MYKRGFAVLCVLLLILVVSMVAPTISAQNVPNPGDTCVVNQGFQLNVRVEPDSTSEATGAKAISNTSFVVTDVTQTEEGVFVTAGNGWLLAYRASDGVYSMTCSGVSRTRDVAPETTAEAAPTATVNFNEPLVGTLDDFGGKVDEFDRFAKNDGTQIRFELAEGDLWVANATAIQNGSTVMDKGCVIGFAAGPAEVYLTGWDGQWFRINNAASKKLTLNQGIAAMRDTLTKAFQCKLEGIKFFNVARPIPGSSNTGTGFRASSAQVNPLDLARSTKFFALDGTIYDESFELQKELFVAYTVKGGSDAANDATIPACSILVYKAPAEGGRFRIEVSNGAAYEWEPEMVKPSEAVAAVTAVAQSTNACETWTQYDVERFGDPVN